MEENIKVIAAFGLGYSGSTLLSFMLDSHSAIYGGGELHWLLERKKQELDFYVGCRHCNDDCGFWSNDNIEAINEKNFYSHIASIFKKRIIVDTSKMPKWFEYIKQENNGAPVEFVDLLLTKHPVRHLASVVTNVLFRELQDLDKVEQVFYEEMEKWIKRFSRFYTPFFQEEEEGKRNFSFLLKYEDLVLKTEMALIPLLNFLGVQYEQAVYNCYDYPHHIIGGNGGTLFQVLKTWSEYKEKIHPARKKQYHKEKGVFLDNRYLDVFTSEQLEWLRNHPGIHQLNSMLGYQQI